MNDSRSPVPLPTGIWPRTRRWITQWLGYGSAALGAAEARPPLTLSLAGMVLAVGYTAGVFAFPATHGRIVNGDAIQYYAYLRSAVFDGDLDFLNDYRLLYGETGASGNVWLTTRTSTGRPPNLMSVGPAILWAPFYLSATMILRVAGHGPLDGTEPVLQASVGLAGIFYATLGSCLTFWACARLFPRAAAFWATVVVWLAGPAVYYSFVSPTYSHATSWFAVALFVGTWLKTREQPRLGRTVLLGALGGLVALVRWQDAVVLLLPVAEALDDIHRGRSGRAAAFLHLAVMGATASIVCVPQLLAWQAIYGTPVLVPQGKGFMRWSQPEILAVLFSLKHGLFSWTPALLPAVVGLPLLVKRDRLVGWSTLLVMAITVYVSASVQDWWAGAAFGSRRFVGYGVFFTLGLAALLSWPPIAQRPRTVGWVSVALVAYNLLFLLQYQLFMRGMIDLVPYPTTAKQIFIDRLLLPAQLVWRWM
jgi:hypothetical protein